MDRLISPQEAARMLGVSVRLISRFIERDLLPSRKIANKRGIPLAALRRAMKKGVGIRADDPPRGSETQREVRICSCGFAAGGLSLRRQRAVGHDHSQGDREKFRQALSYAARVPIRYSNRLETATRFQPAFQTVVFVGSARESGKLCILRGFLKNQEFGLGGG
jgi:hypothetical protein